MIRADREDLTVQRARVEEAAKALYNATDWVAQQAKAAKRTRDLAPVYGAVKALRRAEEAYDLARLDLATASGEDA